MSDADELLFVTEGDYAMPVLKPDRARGPQTRHGDANEFVEKDAAVRVASAFWHELKLASPAPLRVRYHNTTGISATNFLRSGVKAGWKLSLDGIQVESGCISAAVHTRVASLRRGGTAAAPANASNKVKADQKALNSGSGYRDISIARRISSEGGKGNARRNDDA
jgi:hypothetical protein